MRLVLIAGAAAVLIWATDPADIHFGSNDAFRLERSQDSFGVRSHGVMEGAKLYPLPQSTFEDYARLRAADLKLNPLAATGGEYHRQEVIGPYQVEGDRLWFGKAFYDAEGDRGVGAFGYFDTKTRSYELFSPTEIAPYEVSAILVDQYYVLLALDHFGESASKSAGGVIRWQRSTHAVDHYAFNYVISGFGPEIIDRNPAPLSH